MLPRREIAACRVPSSPSARSTSSIAKEDVGLSPLAATAFATARLLPRREIAACRVSSSPSARSTSSIAQEDAGLSPLAATATSDVGSTVT